MKKLLLILALFLPLMAFPKGIKFFEGSYAQALEKAKKENKYVFVDFYAIWCGPCKYMSANVFTDSLIGEFFNKNFVSVKIDAEKYEKDLVKNVKVEAYPTLAFFKKDGTLFYKLKGGMDIPGFMKLGKQVAEFDKNRLAYEKNKKDVKSMTSYLLVLQQSEPEKAKNIALGYLNSIPVEKSVLTENWTLILTFDRSYDSRFFKYSIDNFRYFLDSVPGFKDYYSGVTNELIRTAVDKRDSLLLVRYKEYSKVAMQSTGQEYTNAFNSEVDIFYYAQSAQKEKHIQAMDEYLMWYTSSVQTIGNNCYEMIERYGIAVIYPYVERWAKKAMTVEKGSYTSMLYAYIMRENGNKAEAKRYAAEALTLAGPDDDTQHIRDFISELED
jgi:thioredoxin-related protein